MQVSEPQKIAVKFKDRSLTLRSWEERLPGGIFWAGVLAGADQDLCG
jgi:hypothetical protein